MKEKDGRILLKTWMERNCKRCVKAPHQIDNDEGLLLETECRCHIWTELLNYDESPNTLNLSERTRNAVKNCVCPHLQEHYKQHKKVDKFKGVPKLFKK